MKIKIKQVIDSVKEVLGDRNYLLGFIITNVIFFGFFIYIPVLITAGNTLKYQLQIYTSFHLILLGTLALLTSLIITMRVYTYKKRKKLGVGTTALGSSAGIFGVLVGTATCPSCFALVFGFLGIGGSLFLFKYQIYFVSSAILIMLLSLYYTSKSVSGVCKNC